jgi:hypothetical protein
LFLKLQLSLLAHFSLLGLLKLLLLLLLLHLFLFLADDCRQLFLLLVEVFLSLRFHISLSFDLFFLPASLVLIHSDLSLQSLLAVPLELLQLLESLIRLHQLLLPVLMIRLLVQRPRHTPRPRLEVIVLSSDPHLNLIMLVIGVLGHQG